MGLTRAACTQDTPSGGVIRRRPNRRVSQTYRRLWRVWMVRWLGNSSVRSLMIRVNVNTTDATTGATALLLSAQNSHTDPCACVRP
jgi:hypothetical protein